MTEHELVYAEALADHCSSAIERSQLFADADEPPPLDAIMIDPGEIEELVVTEVGNTALFGARFRENAARALLIPRRRPGQRSPLWQQRLKAQSLLQVARKYGSFPIVLETYRECLQDWFDLPALTRLLAGVQSRQIDVVDVETASASPYAAALLFDYIATYMYEDDTPPADRRAQALSLDRDLLRDLLDPAAIAEVEAALRGDPRTPDDLHDLLRLRGDLAPGEYATVLAAPLLAERRTLLVRLAGEERLIAAEDAGRYRDALGVMPPRWPGGRVPRRRRGAAGVAAVALGPRPRPLHHGRRGHALRARRARRRCAAARLRARRPPRPRRAAAGRQRAGVVRPRGAAADPPADAGARAQGGRGGRAGDPRPLPAELARDRPPRDAARGAGAAAGARAAGGAVGVGAAAAPGAGIHPGGARRAVRQRRGGVGGGGARPGRRLLPRRRRRARAAERGCAVARRRRPRRDPRRARQLCRVLVRPARRNRPRRCRGIAGAVGSRLGRRGDERRVDAAAGRPSLRAGEGRAAAKALLAPARRRDYGYAGPLVAGRPALPGRSRAARPRRAPARAARHRHARWGARRRDRRRLRRRLRRAAGAGDVGPGAARLLRRGAWRGAVRPRGSGGAAARVAPARRRAARRARAGRRRPGPAVRRRRAVAEAGGRARPRRRRPGRAARRRGRAVRRAGRALAGAAARPPTRAWLEPALAALVAHVRGRGPGNRLAVERFDGVGVLGSPLLDLLLAAGFTARPRRLVLRS